MEYGRVARVQHEKIKLEGSPEVRFQIAQATFSRLDSPVALSLPSTKVLRRTLTLPDALEENLKQALAYDLDRHTPFRAEDLYFDAHVTGHQRDRSEITVAFAALPRKAVDKAIKTLNDMGAEVEAVLADPPQDADSEFNLLPGSDKPKVSVQQYGIVAGVSFLLLLLLVAAIALPIWQKRDYAIKLGKQVDQVRGQAQEVEQLRNTLDQIVADYDFVLERKDAYPTVAETLERVTRVMPDDTWLSRMEIRTVIGNNETQRNLVVGGESKNASQLVALLEESRFVTQAAPTSPIARIQQTDSERFDIGARIKPREESEREIVMAPEPEPEPPPPVVETPPPPQPAAAAPAATPAVTPPVDVPVQSVVQPEAVLPPQELNREAGWEGTARTTALGFGPRPPPTQDNQDTFEEEEITDDAEEGEEVIIDEEDVQ